MQRRIYAGGILIVAAAALAFIFAPVIPFTTPVVVDSYFSAQVSPSYYLFRCGVVYNLATVFTENGQVMVGMPGPSLICNHKIGWTLDHRP